MWCTGSSLNFQVKETSGSKVQLDFLDETVFFIFHTCAFWTGLNLNINNSLNNAN